MVLPRKPRGKKLYGTINSSTEHHKFSANKPTDAVRSETGAGTFLVIFDLFQVPSSNSGSHCNSVTILIQVCKKKRSLMLPYLCIVNYFCIARYDFPKLKFPKN